MLLACGLSPPVYVAEQFAASSLNHGTSGLSLIVAGSFLILQARVHLHLRDYSSI